MSENQPKKRDGGLTFWLALILIGNIIFLLSQLARTLTDLYFVFLPLGAVILIFFDVSSGVSSLWSIPLFVIYSAISICSVMLLLAWRKGGFYAICITTIAAFITGIVTAGILTFGIIVNCVGTIILGILLRSEWKLFR